MTRRRSKLEDRCSSCRVHKMYCYCNKLECFKNKTPVSIIMHFREQYLTTNTVNLAKIVLSNLQVIQRGKDPLIVENELKVSKSYTPLFLFPDEGAHTLDKKFMEKRKEEKFHLIIPDGSWRQAKKIKRREDSLDKIESVVLPAVEGGSRYKLRKQSRVEGLCTYEALAYALGVLESEDLQEQMLKQLDVMVECILKSRI